MEYVHRYMVDREVKHLFPKEDQEAQASCGAGYMWYISDYWKDDEETLKVLRECELCLKNIKAKNVRLEAARRRREALTLHG